MMIVLNIKCLKKTKTGESVNQREKKVFLFQTVFNPSSLPQIRRREEELVKVYEVISLAATKRHIPHPDLTNV